ncbi:MAG: TolC family protein [Planctomycetota bacterium]|nr:TolC family protein [Planctomycetota bacterium]MDP7248418.1 TolC family protein [Planctomycetota bacterium]
MDALTAPRFNIMTYCLCLILAPVAAEEILLDLSGCLSLALKQSPRLKISNHEVALAQAKLDEARSGRKPRLEIMNFAGAVTEARGNAVASSDRITDTDDLGPFNRLEMNLIQPIYTFGKLTSYVDSALHGLDAERAKRRQRRDELIYHVKKLYYSNLLNADLTELLTQTRKAFAEAHDTMQAIIDGDKEAPDGEEPAMLDFVKLKVGLAQVTYNLKRITQAEDLTRSALKQALGLRGDSVLRIKEESLRSESSESRNLEFYVNQTFRNRPEWQQLEAGLQAKESLMKAAKKDFYPEVFVAVPFRYAAAGNRDDQKNPFVRDDFNFVEGGPVVGLRWQINFGKSARAEQAKEEHNILLAQREEARSGFAVEIRKAWLGVKEMEERVTVMRKARGAARALTAGSKAVADMGVQDLEELFESYGLYTKAQSDYLLALYEHNLALADLSLKVGMEVTKLKY